MKVRDFAKFSGEKKNPEYETANLQEYGSNVFYLTQKKKSSLSLQREFMIQHEHTSAPFLSPLSQSSYKQVTTSLTRLLHTRNVCIEHA